MYADEDDDSYFDYEEEGYPSLATRSSGYGGTTRNMSEGASHVRL